MKKPNEIPSNLKRGALPEPHQALENIRRRNINRLIFAQLNINSLRNKFESLQHMINKNIDVLLISETKIDSSFPSAQFHLEGYATPYRLDRNANGGGILLYIREDIPSKLLNTDLSIEGFFVEIRLRKKKWLLCSSYNPKKNLIANHLKCIGRNLDSQLGQYENFILMGDFNVEPNDANMKDFCQIYGCKNIVKDKTCFKNPINPTCIDLIITNRPKSFQESEVIETKLSDFHKMNLTVMKVFYNKQKPKIIQYRKYKGFSNEAFMQELKSALARFSQFSFRAFKSTVDYILQKHAPIKKRYVRANQASFMNSKIHKEVMRRTRLRNKFIDSKTDADRIAYNKQRNYCVTLIRKEKKAYYSNLNIRDVTDNKTFWRKVKPLFSEKVNLQTKILLVEKGNDLSDPEISSEVEKVISEDKEIAETFNEFFVNIVPSLKISPKENYETDVGNDNEPILNYINKFKNHPSIKVIKSRKKEEQTFTFRYVSYEEVLNEIRKLQTKKTTQQNDIPTKILKKNSEVFAGYFQKNINFCIENSIFPSDLKVADVTPAFKKKSKTSKDNYRPISILPNVSKIYERCLYNQMQTYFDNLLSKYQCGFRKGFNAQHCLVSMIEKWKESVDSGGAFGALMTDLSKAFDCLHHELLIAKLDAYGFDIKSVKLIQTENKGLK